MKCKNCGKQDTSCIEISDATKNAIRYSILADPKKIFSFTISDNSLQELKMIADIYLNEKLEKEYKLEKLF